MILSNLNLNTSTLLKVRDDLAIPHHGYGQLLTVGNLGNFFLENHRYKLYYQYLCYPFQKDQISINVKLILLILNRLISLRFQVRIFFKQFFH